MTDAELAEIRSKVECGHPPTRPELVYILARIDGLEAKAEQASGYMDSLENANDSLRREHRELEARLAKAEAVVEDVQKWKAVGNAAMDMREVIQSTKKLITTITAYEAYVAADPKPSTNGRECAGCFRCGVFWLKDKFTGCPNCGGPAFHSGKINLLPLRWINQQSDVPGPPNPPKPFVNRMMG